MNPPKPSPGQTVQDDGGFTLLELLITVTITIVLSFVALVVFGNQKARADDAVTQQRVSSLGHFVTAALAAGSIDGAIGGQPGLITSDFGSIETSGAAVYVDAASSATSPTFCISAVSSTGRAYAYTSASQSVYEGENGSPCTAPTTTPTAAAASQAGGNRNITAPTSDVLLTKNSLIYDADAGIWLYELTWTASPSEEGVTGYKVYRVNPDATGAILGVNPDSDAWTLAATVTSTTYTFTPGDMSLNVASTAGSWKAFRVVPTNAAGDGPTSNQVVISDGFRQSRGSWLACAVVATGKVRVAVQIPDTWNIPSPISWRLTNSGGSTLASGTNTDPGILSADVPTGTVLGRVYLTAADGTAYAFTGGGTGTANYTVLYSSVNSSGVPNKRC